MGLSALARILAMGLLAAALIGLAHPQDSLSSSPTIVAIDADPSGNSPRRVGDIDDCVSGSVGQQVEIDIVIPDPGIPLDRGIAGYQFTLFYNPAIVWVAGDDSQMLLDQAQGSVIIPLADPLPDTNGVYSSGAVDFGPQGIEPAGASETGPGVLARITLELRSDGLSPLVLKDVLLLDDTSNSITIDSVQGATIAVGQPCPGQSLTPTPTPGPASTTQGTEASPPKPTPTPTPQAAIPRDIPASGGPPPQGPGPPVLTFLPGLALTAAGLILAALAWRAQPTAVPLRRQTYARKKRHN